MASVEQAVAVLQTATSPQPQKLRVGLFVDKRLQPRWAIEAFAKVVRSGIGDIVLIAAGDSEPCAPLLCRLYDGIDRWAFGGGDDPAELADILPALAHKKFMHLDSVAPGALDLDVAFALGELDDTKLDGIARYGVWRFYFGEDAAAGARLSEAMAGWREVAEGAPLTGSGLKVRLACGAAPRLAYQSWSRTYPFSVARNRAQLLAKTSEFAFRALRELQRSGHGWLEQCKPAKGVAGEAPPVPGTIDLVKNLGAIGARIAHRGIEKALNVEQWFLAYRFREARLGDERAVPADLKGYTRLLPPKDRYWADPFVLEKNGRYFVFFEELPFKAGRAHISMIEIDRVSGRASAPVRVLERDYHLSYPFLLEHDGQH
jgi:hypothetical protein